LIDIPKETNKEKVLIVLLANSAIREAAKTSGIGEAKSWVTNFEFLFPFLVFPSNK
jgi:hypothetical protein